MANNQVRKRRPAGKGRRSLARHLRTFDLDHLALPQDEIRRLVAGSTTRTKIEPFVKQMVRVMDNLKAGRFRRVATLTVSRRDQSRATLITGFPMPRGKGTRWPHMRRHSWPRCTPTKTVSIICARSLDIWTALENRLLEANAQVLSSVRSAMFIAPPRLPITLKLL